MMTLYQWHPKHIQSTIAKFPKCPQNQSIQRHWGTNIYWHMLNLRGMYVVSVNVIDWQNMALSTSSYTLLLFHFDFPILCIHSYMLQHACRYWDVKPLKTSCHPVAFGFNCVTRLDWAADLLSIYADCNSIDVYYYCYYYYYFLLLLGWWKATSFCFSP